MHTTVGKCYGICAESLRRRKIYYRYGKAFHVPLKACGYRKKTLKLWRRGLAARSVRVARVELIQELI